MKFWIGYQKSWDGLEVRPGAHYSSKDKAFQSAKEYNELRKLNEMAGLPVDSRIFRIQEIEIDSDILLWTLFAHSNDLRDLRVIIDRMVTKKHSDVKFGEFVDLIAHSY